MKIKYNSKKVRLAGNITVYFGLFDFLAEHIVRYFENASLEPTSLSVATETGIAAIIIAGLLALLIARVLQNIEERLDTISSIQKTNNQ